MNQAFDRHVAGLVMHYSTVAKAFRKVGLTRDMHEVTHEFFKKSYIF
jgi:hypothetical protein